jgi:hypothetical protein
VRLFPLLAPAISFLLLAAHFVRAGLPAGTVAAGILVALLFVRRPWAARAAQAALLLGAAEWVRTLVGLVAARRESDAPWARLGVILAAVAAGTAASALVFRSGRLSRWYGDPSESKPGS